MTEFSVGDLVRLKSGSPDLCVTGVFGAGTWDAVIAVSWFTSDGVLHDAELPADALDLSCAKVDVHADDETDLEAAEAELFQVLPGGQDDPAKSSDGNQRMDW